MGVVAGAILWEAIFLRESGPFTWQLVGWMELMLLGGSITLAWARGLSYRPKQAAKFGALTGAITGATIDLIFALSLWIFAIIPARPIYDQIADTLFATFRWGSYGFLGGLAIEKEWGRRSAARVALGVGAVGIVIVFIQALHEWSFMIIPFWVGELCRQFLRAGGWALGLMFFPKSDEVLQGRYERQPRRNDVTKEINERLSREQADKIESGTRSGLKLELEVALAATIGITAATIIREAILNGDLFDWSLGKWTAIVLVTGFMAWLSRKYFDPFIERLGGTRQTPNRPRMRLSVHVILAIAVIALVTRFVGQAFEDDPMKGVVLWLMYAITAGSITFAWARGVYRSPERAAEFGALTGASVFSVSFALIFVTWALIIGAGVDQVIVRTIVFSLEWGLYGLLGGLAIERRWGDRLAVRMGMSVESTSVALGVATIGVLLGTLLGFLTGNVGPPYWKETFTRVLFIAAGWAWGLMLFPKSEDVLKIRKEREEPDYVAPTDQLTTEHNS
jgi:hypothetical protein